MIAEKTLFIFHQHEKTLGASPKNMVFCIALPYIEALDRHHSV